MVAAPPPLCKPSCHLCCVAGVTFPVVPSPTASTVTQLSISRSSSTVLLSSFSLVLWN